MYRMVFCVVTCHLKTFQYSVLGPSQDKGILLTGDCMPRSHGSVRGKILGALSYRFRE